MILSLENNLLPIFNTFGAFRFVLKELQANNAKRLIFGLNSSTVAEFRMCGPQILIAFDWHRVSRGAMEWHIINLDPKYNNFVISIRAAKCKCNYYLEFQLWASFYIFTTTGECLIFDKTVIFRTVRKAINGKDSLPAIFSYIDVNGWCSGKKVTWTWHQR